jgi:4-amino-4-deoxy-L-arabinose transferase-like glycosyltransferase
MKKETSFILVLLIITLITRLPFLPQQALIRDEAVYAQMIDEFIENPTLVPHFLGYEVAWRPILFVLPYVLIISSMNSLPLPVEVIYRFPSLLFALLTTVVMYFLVKELYNNEELAFLSTLIYTTTALVIYVNSSLLADTLLVLLILLSTYAYVKGRDDERYFILAGALSFSAYMVKTVIAFMIPLLALAYYFFSNRRMLKNRLFLLSMLGIPIAIVAYYLMFSDPSTITSEYTGNIMGRLGADKNWASDFLRSVVPFVFTTLPWLGLYIVGILKHWKGNWFMLVWAFLMIFPVFFGTLMPWYYLIVIPPLSVFAALSVIGKRIDLLTVAFSSFFIILALMATVFFYDMKGEAFGQKEVGLFLAGKNNTLLIGDYTPTTVFYKLHDGEEMDFCWIISQNSSSIDKEYLDSTIYGYNAPNGYNFSTRLNDIFWEGRDLKMPCNITRFDYVVTKDINRTLMENDTNYRLLREFNENITVYERIR